MSVILFDMWLTAISGSPVAPGSQPVSGLSAVFAEVVRRQKHNEVSPRFRLNNVRSLFHQLTLTTRRAPGNLFRKRLRTLAEGDEAWGRRGMVRSRDQSRRPVRSVAGHRICVHLDSNFPIKLCNFLGRTAHYARHGATGCGLGDRKST